MKIWKQPIPTNLDEIFGEDYGCQLLYKELIYRSATKDGFFTYKKKTAPIKRGQVVFGRHQWSLYLQQNGSTLRNWLIKLEKSYNLINNQSNNNYTLVTIKNYEDVVSFNNQNDNHLTTTSQPADTSKNIDIKDKNSKNSHVPCTEEELKHISNTKRVSLKDVKKKHNEILTLIEEKTIKKYNSKTTYHTLMRWIEKGIDDGKIHQMSESDWEDEMLLSAPIPPKIQEWFKTLES